MIALINRKRLITSLTYRPRNVNRHLQFEWEIEKINEMFHIVTIRNTNNNIVWQRKYGGFDSENIIITTVISSLLYSTKNLSHLEKYQ